MQALGTIFRRYPQIRPTNFVQDPVSANRNTAACYQVVPALSSLNIPRGENYIPAKQKMIEEEQKEEPELERHPGSLHDNPTPPTCSEPSFMNQNTSNDDGLCVPSTTFKMEEEKKKNSVSPSRPPKFGSARNSVRKTRRNSRKGSVDTESIRRDHPMITKL